MKVDDDSDYSDSTFNPEDTVAEDDFDLESYVEEEAPTSFVDTPSIIDSMTASFGRVTLDELKMSLPYISYSWENELSEKRYTIDVTLPSGCTEDQVDCVVDPSGYSIKTHYIYPQTLFEISRLEVFSNLPPISHKARAMANRVREITSSIDDGTSLFGTMTVKLPYQVEPNVYTEQRNKSGKDIGLYTHEVPEMAEINQFIAMYHIELKAVQKITKKSRNSFMSYKSPVQVLHL